MGMMAIDVNADMRAAVQTWATLTDSERLTYLEYARRLIRTLKGTK